eukprot:367346_1
MSVASMAMNQASKLKKLQQDFITADKDGDSLLNKQEFKEFVEIGYQKQCPNGMYENLCKHFNRDADIGIDWNTARTVWLQAQGGANKRSKSPQPPKPQNGTIQQQNPSQSIKQAFIQCDKDGDGLLNKSEFTQFVKVGFKKPSVPNGMYEQVCGHFKKDLDKGIDWLSAFALWKQSNPNAATAKSNTTSISASPSPNKKTTNNKKRPPNLKRLQTVGVISTSKSHNKSPRHKKNNIPPIGQLSPTKSTGQLYAKKHHSTESFSGSASALTERNLRALEKNNISTYKDDDDRSVDSERSYRSSRDRRHRRIVSTSRNAERLASFDDGVDATSMVVSMMETKVKNLQKSLNIERGKRKKTEELAQSLLTTNEEYKKQINEYTSKNTKLVSENIKIKPQLKKLKQQIDDDRNTIKHLKEQRNSKKNERDEAYQLLTKIEKEHSIMIKKEKAKHKEQMEKLSAGFLQSLGAEPGTDITTHIKQLKANNKDLQRKVDELAATLARKSESLVHALQAVDNLAMIDEKNQVAQYVAASQLVNEVQPAVNNNSRSSNKDKMKNKLKELNARRKSFSMNKNKDSASNISGLPKPPKRRNSQVGIKPHHRPTATFFKRAVGDHSTTHQNKLNISNAKNGKELQFVSQQLTSDVANKTQSIQNLELANTALMEQMEKMKKQMDDMKKKKNGSK